MADDAAPRVFLSRDLSRDSGDLVLGCERCGMTRVVDPEESVVDQLLSYLDQHTHSG